MSKNYPFAEIQTRIAGSQKMLIILPPNPTFDQSAAALGLYLSLSGSGKPLEVFCSTPMTVELNRLVGVDKVSDKIQGTDLVISLNYPPDQVEKVSYNDDAGRPNIVIQPKIGASPLNEKLVGFSYAGSGADVVFCLGIASLDKLSAGNQVIGANGQVVNIDTQATNTGFGAVNVLDREASCLSEIILGLVSGLNLSLSPDAAQNLLSGLWQATGGLSTPVLGPDVYEAVAICLRAGAQKPAEVLGGQPINKEVKPEPVGESKEIKTKKEEPAAPPADWFEPKIFKGSSIA